MRFSGGDTDNRRHWTLGEARGSFAPWCTSSGLSQSPHSLALPASVSAQANSLLPVPSSVRPSAGSLPIDSTTGFAITAFSDARLVRAVERAEHRLAERVAQPLVPRPADDGAAR